MLRFRAVLAEDDAQLSFYGQRFDLISENSCLGCNDASGIVGEEVA
jgi:hypothetical protein